MAGPSVAETDELLPPYEGIRLDRRARRVQVMAIEAKPRFAAQRVPRTKADGFHALI